MSKTNTPKPIGRKALRDALETVPMDTLFSPGVSRELTAKQKKFAREVAMGATKADAYRKAYKPTSKWTMQTQPYQLSKDERVKNEIEAIKRAIAAQEYQTPAALRALVIQSLVQVITDPDAKPGQITAAAKVLGTVTEVAAFTERKEVRTITSSEDARAKILAELKQLANAEAEDVEAVDADSLLAELAAEEKPSDSDPHPPPGYQMSEQESRGYLHTIPHERSQFSPDPDPTPSSQDDPPSSFER